MSDAVVLFENVGKMYKVFPSKGENVMDALGIRRWFPRATPGYREFWALRGIDFELPRGGRLGIIGRNGAGKSTLLKLITGNLHPTEGQIRVEGAVQALLEIGGGLHPEFTGHENIEAALIHLGLSAHEIVEAKDEIADFTELGRFLEQPFKTYSLGMQARLSFAIATTVRPEILIIDEILGAGDAYFFGKSSARMRELIEGGASVILVSHALDQIVRFCDETVWIDRGRIAMRGPSIEVVKAYEKFIRELDDKRLLAKNRKMQSQRFDAFERESYTDFFTVRMTPRTADGGRLEIAEVVLLKGDAVDDRIEVGGPQDANTTQSAHVLLEAGSWGSPEKIDGAYLRAIGTEADGPTLPEAAADVGNVIFHLWFFYPDARYAIDVRHRGCGGEIAMGRGGRLDSLRALPASDEWTTTRLEYAEPRALEKVDEGHEQRRTREISEDDDDATTSRLRPSTTVSRWAGAGSLVMGNVRLVDEAGNDQAVFVSGRRFRVEIDVIANENGPFPLIPAALIFRSDGIVTTRHVMAEQETDVQKGETLHLALDLDPLLLGNGTYVLSLGLYKKLDLENVEASEFYDYFDKSFEFQVVGNPPLHNEIVRHPAHWSLAIQASDEPEGQTPDRRTRSAIS